MRGQEGKERAKQEMNNHLNDAKKDEENGGANDRVEQMIDDETTHQTTERAYQCWLCVQLVVFPVCVCARSFRHQQQQRTTRTITWL